MINNSVNNSRLNTYSQSNLAKQNKVSFGENTSLESDCDKVELSSNGEKSKKNGFYNFISELAISCLILNILDMTLFNGKFYKSVKKFLG